MIRPTRPKTICVWLKFCFPLGSSTILTSVCFARSNIVGIPSERCSDGLTGFGIQTRLDGFAFSLISKQYINCSLSF